MPASSPPPSSARIVALTGCDGSGKSTLTARLAAHLGTRHAAQLVYLGQSSGRIGEWIGTLPLVGGVFQRYLLRKSEHMHTHPAAAPGGGAALVVFLLSCWRAHKFRRVQALARRGVLVITDRWPQAAVPGFRFDGPQLAKTTGGSALVRWLRRREQRLYDRMAAQPPRLVIRLNVDAETAHARKPDHALAMLREKTAMWPQLTFPGAPILDLDGREPADLVYQQALQAIVSACGLPPESA